MKTTKRNKALLTLAAALLLAAPSAQAEDNTGTGGTVTYTDSSGANPAATPYPGGYVVHTFTGLHGRRRRSRWLHPQHFIPCCRLEFLHGHRWGGRRWR
ncbi:MAG: hypothetical protein NTW21_40790 [Verrucomicrobia bacterium]|nr:hypothetical protein [Verrucomicrobiota bacterium]